MLVVALLIAAATSKNIDSFVSNGLNAGRHDFPFKAGLLSTVGNAEIRCGGSLISRVAVLTAASCLHGASSTVVVLGGTDLANPSERFQSRFRVPSSNFRIHSQFIPGAENNDIAIVRFEFPLSMFTQAVNIVQLPLDGTLSTFNNQPAVVMGFGQYSQNPAATHVLRFIEVTTMTNALCSRTHRLLLASQICTASGSQRRGTCPGDEGSPLVIESGNGYLQIGIVGGFSGSACLSSNPSVYTRVTSFLPWIHQNMQ